MKCGSLYYSWYTGPWWLRYYAWFREGGRYVWAFLFRDKIYHL